MKLLILLSVTILLTSCVKKNKMDLTKIPADSAIHTNYSAQAGSFSKVDQAYVPVYSDLLLHDENNHIALQGFVSIRNTDPKLSLKISKILYYDTNGKLIKNYVDLPIFIKAFASYNVVIKSNDLDGGSGAKILVNYSLHSKKSQEPLIEALFTGVMGTKAISFSSRAVKLKK